MKYSDEPTVNCEEILSTPFRSLRSKHVITNERNDAKPKTDSSSMWSQSGNMFMACDEALKVLPAGHYVARYSSAVGPFLQSKPLDMDDLIHNIDESASRISTDIEKFLGSKTKYVEYGFLWKRGYLLYGPPGTGKTSLVQTVSKKFIDIGGIVLFGDELHSIIECLPMIRTIEKDRPILVLLEEIDQLIQQGEHSLLSMLDGELQVDNIIFIATTNYPERLDARIINRPSRFDIIGFIGYPEYTARYNFLKAKAVAVDEDTLSLWASKTKDMSYAHLKEIIIACQIMDTPFEDVITRLNLMKMGKFTSDDDSEKTLGFMKGNH